MSENQTYAPGLTIVEDGISFLVPEARRVGKQTLTIYPVCIGAVERISALLSRIHFEKDQEYTDPAIVYNKSNRSILIKIIARAITNSVSRFCLKDLKYRKLLKRSVINPKHLHSYFLLSMRQAGIVSQMQLMIDLGLIQSANE